jgi:DNA-binding response OmpR family regulator
MSAPSGFQGKVPADPNSPTILVVEDEEAVRSLVQLVLQTQGFNLLLADHGEDALELSHRHAGAIDLLLTDWYLPDMRGEDLARRLTMGRHETKVLFMSGSDKTLCGEAPAGFLRKPFTTTELIAHVRAALGQDPR